MMHARAAAGHAAARDAVEEAKAELARLDDEIAFEGTRVARAMEEGDQVRWSTAAVAIEEGALRVDRAAKATDRRIQATATRTIACTAEELARAAGYKGPGLCW